MERLFGLRSAVFAALLLTAVTAGAAPKTKVARVAKPSGEPSSPAKTRGPFSWCGEGTEALPNGLCHIDGGQPEGRRSLVVFLHGAIAKDVDWQWLQERALTRQAKASKFEAIFAQAPLGAGGYVWPGTKDAQEANEQRLIDGWSDAKDYLEKKNGKYDDVFLMGFSSGAYFVSSLALRGRTKFDGYAVFAGGAGFGAAGAETPATKAPVYVGVCAEDRQTADHSRAFGSVLNARGWPNRVDEQKVGHMFSDIHVAHAITYLRAANAKRKTE
jgi:predicted esterase